MSSCSRFTYFLLVFMFLEDVSTAKPGAIYCEFGYCEADQYCCGDNKCCDKLLNLWYFWLGLGIVIVVVAGIIFLKLYLWKKRSSNYKYKVLEQTQS